MKKLVWVAGAVLLVSFVFPNGVAIPVVKPAVDVVEPSAAADAEISKLLRNADAADKGRVRSIYSGLASVLRRDATVKRLRNTEQWAEVHAATLDLAVEQVGKYPGLDVAINDVFLRVVGTDDVMPANDSMRAKLIEACDVIVASAR